MLKVDGSLDHVPAKRGHVISLYESINQPLVNIPGYGAAPTGAYILGTRNDRGAFTVFVYLFQPETRAVLVYICEPRALTAEQFKREEQEAVRFAESMGFMVDDLRFAGLGVPEQEAVMTRVPLFRPPGRGPDGRTDVRFGAVGGVVTGRPEVSAGSWPHEGSGSARSLPSSLPPTPSSSPGSAAGAPLSAAAGSPLTGPLTAAPDGRSVRPSGSYPQPPRPSGAHPRPGPAPSGAPGSHVSPAPSSVEPTNGVALGRGLPMPGAERGPPPRLSAERRARLGRLLGTFALPFALSWTSVACATAPSEPSRAQEAERDLGYRALADGQWAEALRHFESVLDDHGDDGLAHRGAGLAYWRLDRPKQAESHLREAVGSDERWSDPKNDLAVVLLDQGRCEEAQKLLRKVLDDIYYPLHHFADHNLARAEACAGDVPGALRRLEALAERRPKFCKAYLTASELAEGARLHEATIEACENFKEYCEKDEELGEKIALRYKAGCDLRKGRAYLAVGDVESARTAFERCRAAPSTRAACRDALAMLPP